MDSDNKKTILLIEDDFSLQKLYQIKFEQEGFVVITASDGEAGFNAAKEKTPDFIMLDNMLPKIKGLDVLMKLKNDEITKSIPVMMLSNLAVREEKEKAIRFGALDYVAKASKSPEDIAVKVKGYLGIK